MPSKVENVVQEDRFSVSIQIKSTSSLQFWINLSWHQKTARMCLLSSTPAGLDGPLSFASTLNAFLKNMILTDIEIPYPFERVAVLKFSEKLNAQPKLSMYVEVLGTRSNVILVSCEDNIVQSAAYQTSSSSTRVVKTNSEYYPPIIQSDKVSPESFIVDPGTYNFDTFKKLLLLKIDPTSGKGIDTALTSSFQGLSSVISRLLIEKSMIDHGEEATVSNVDMVKLYDFFLEWIDLATNSPTASEKIKHDYFAPFYMETYSPNTVGPKTAALYSKAREMELNELLVNSVLSKYFVSMERSLSFNTTKAQCYKLLQSQQRRVKNLHQLFLKARNDASDEKLKKNLYKADLITSFIYKWKEGDDSVVCEDFETQQEVTIQLPHGMSPMIYVEKLYNKCKKLKRSTSVVETLLKKVATYQSYLDEVDSSLMILDVYRSNEDIIALKENLVLLESIQKYLHSMYSSEFADGSGKHSTASLPKAVYPKANTKKIKESKRKKKSDGGSITKGSNKQNLMQGLLVLQGTVDGGTELDIPLVVGRNSNQNDRISFTVAKEHHKWFHVQGYPGSHCLLLTQPGQMLEKRNLQYAADVAAFYSKARFSKNVPVGYCSPKFLKRAKGGNLGLVEVKEQEGMLYGDPIRGEEYVNNFSQFS